MVKAYFYYDVAVEKQAEYLKFVAEELSENVTNFMAEMIFDDLPSMQKTMGLHGKDPEYNDMVQRSFSFVSDQGVKPLGRYEQTI